LPRKNHLFLVHQSGERDYNAVRVAYARREINAEVVPFISNMAEEFARTDLIVCRAGAITAAEVAAAGRAAIFIPFGAATDSHQLRNAQAWKPQGPRGSFPSPSSAHNVWCRKSSRCSTSPSAWRKWNAAPARSPARVPSRTL